MNIFKSRIGIIVLLLILIATTLIFIVFRSQTRSGPGVSTKIPIFIKPSPEPTIIKTYDQLTEEEKLKYQTISDKYYTKTQDDILQAYPWFNKFPISAGNYFLYIDLDNNQFVGLLYPQKSSAESIDSQVDSFKKEITERMKNIDPKTLELPIKWEVKPE